MRGEHPELIMVPQALFAIGINFAHTQKMAAHSDDRDTFVTRQLRSKGEFQMPFEY